MGVQNSTLNNQFSQIITDWINENDENKILSLEYLNLNNLPTLPNNVKKLDCNSNKLTTLPTLPINLIELNCSFNKLTNLPTLPINLITLNCSFNKLTTLPILPNNVKKLDCNSNKLTNLPILPNNLNHLDCYNNKLLNLPILPNTLKILNCNINKLNNLSILPINLEILNCNNNNLTNLPILPNTLIELDCSDNQLVNLPNIPNNLQKLIIDNINILNNTQINILRHLNTEIYDTNLSIIELPEATEEEIQQRINIANTSLQNIHSNNITNIQNLLNSVEDINDDIPLYLQELDSKEIDIYKERCNNTEDLLGDNLNSKYGNIVILDISNDNKYIAWCFTYPEALEMWQFSKTYNILSYTGQTINQRGVLLSRLYNTFVLRNTNMKSKTYSGHHDIKSIYTLDPISRQVFIQKIKISNDLINNFIPSINDLNLYYLNNLYTQPNNNTISIDNERIVGDLGEIILRKPLIQIVKIIKDNEVGDINKTYKIVGDNVITENN